MNTKRNKKQEGHFDAPPSFKIEKGAHFVCLIFDEWVVKVAHKEKYRNPSEIKKIAEMQNTLAQHMEEVLPCEPKDVCLIMPRVPGVSGDKYPKERQRWLEKRGKEAMKKGLRYGVEIRDPKPANIIYDEETDRIYLIDFSSARRVKK